MAAGGAAVAAPAAAAGAGASSEAGLVAQTAVRAAFPLAAGLAIAAPLVADVVGFVGAQNPAWLQPGLDPAKLTWGPPSATHCVSMAGMPAVEFLCTGTVAGGVKLG